MKRTPGPSPSRAALACRIARWQRATSLFSMTPAPNTMLERDEYDQPPSLHTHSPSFLLTLVHGKSPRATMLERATDA
eukprot:5726101-Prymnesium_polylepis.2